ncbi:hypothetical protein ACZ76_15660 [Yersinia aleksiciae]|uniref:Uncharacterized protein n=1 Tax=Yersinia aleksiciae TaxID=263819 RepID=A0ABN4H9S6_YERAE|nr:hypothetical protein ACZ76_15660 [Yersinia aleksiciae]
MIEGTHEVGKRYVRSAGFHKGAAAPFGGWGIGGKVRTEALTTEPEHETEYQPNRMIGSNINRTG